MYENFSSTFQPWDIRNFNNFGTPGSNFNSYTGFGQPFNIFSGSSSITTSPKSSYDSFLEKKTKENGYTSKNDTSFLGERNEEIKNTKEIISEYDQKIKELEKNNNSSLISKKTLEPVETDINGKFIKRKDEKTGFFKKIGKWCSSAGSALVNIGKSLIGFDKDGKWNPVKCLKNVAITAAAVGLSFIPVVGPVLGYGLLAAGVVSGGIGVAKGISKLNKARTEVEEEQARQEICTGSFVGITSAMGLRGLGKSVSTAAKVSGASNTAKISALAKPRTTALGKVIQNVSQFTRDITVNPLKAVKSATLSDLQAVKSTAFFSTWKNKITGSYNSMYNHKDKFDNKYNQIEQDLKNKITKLDKKINTTTNRTTKQLLEQERKMYNNNLNELKSIKTGSKVELDRLKRENSSYKNQNDLTSFEEKFNANNAQATTEYNQFSQRVINAQDKYAKNLEQLIKAKENLYRQYAKSPDKYRTELDKYTSKNIRNKYNTKEKISKGIEDLSSKIENDKDILKNLENQLSKINERNITKINKVNKQINTIKTRIKNNEDILNICENITLKNRFKPSTWRKNEYQLTIGQNTPSIRPELITTAMQSPGAATIFTKTQWEDKGIMPPLFGDLVTLSNDEKEIYITQLKKERDSLYQGLEALEKINSSRDWNAVKIQLDKQRQAKEETTKEEAKK